MIVGGSVTNWLGWPGFSEMKLRSRMNSAPPTMWSCSRRFFRMSSVFGTPYGSTLTFIGSMTAWRLIRDRMQDTPTRHPGRCSRLANTWPEISCYRVSQLQVGMAVSNHCCKT